MRRNFADKEGIMSTCRHNREFRLKRCCRTEIITHVSLLQGRLGYPHTKRKVRPYGLLQRQSAGVLKGGRCNQVSFLSRRKNESRLESSSDHRSKGILKCPIRKPFSSTQPTYNSVAGHGMFFCNSRLGQAVFHNSRGDDPNRLLPDL